MNRAYRIVWSAARQAWVVTSEKAGCGARPPLAVKKVVTTLLLLGVTGSALATDYSGSTVSSGQTQYLSAGDKADNVTITSGGIQNVSSGGSAASTTVNVDGQQSIFSGGSATAATVNSGGLQNVNSGGTATAATVNSGGRQD
ncbi:ESPR-type extended signal peptide-containing protein, partial [Pantoea stewartii]|uniref:ESPR-type extended signal peptide-containing protein n=1 Tax=Pantoea stewartii TaxID=66269 RepID=UPI0023F8FFC4